MDEEEWQALNDWADKIVTLEPEVVNGVLGFARRLEVDQRLLQADRAFAKSQVMAIKNARRRMSTKKNR